MFKLLNNPGRRIAFVCGSIVWLMCTIVTIGWALNIHALKCLSPGFATMKMNAAVMLALLAGVQVIASLTKPAHVPRRLVSLAVFLATIIATVTLIEYGFNMNLGIDEILFRDPDFFGPNYPPGRPAPITAISVLFLSAAIILNFRKPSFPRWGQSLLLFDILISFQAVVSYAMGLKTTFGFSHYTQMAIPTALSFVLLSVGNLGLTHRRGFMRMVLRQDANGASIRQLLAAALFVPPVVNILESWGREAGLFDADFGMLLKVIGSTAFFVAMVLKNGEQLYRASLREQSDQKLQRQLIDERIRAERVAGHQAEFLARMSHEIRTPINGVIGISDLLSATALNREQDKFVQTLRSSARGLLHVINDILDFSKIEAGKVEIENVDFELRALCQNLTDLLGVQAAQKNLELHFELDPQIPEMIHGDPGRVGQVLMNLIGNALKFTARGEVRLRVKLVSLDQEYVNLHFAVTDTGPGLSNETKSRLFTPFMQADVSTSRRYGGTGLGLSISQYLVTLMGGSIGVESLETQGAQFWFQLKLKAALTCRLPTRVEKIENPEWSGRMPRILVAEDNAINLLIVREHLLDLGLTPHTVGNGLEVLEALKLETFDLILMDCQMPEMDGYTATGTIRANERAGVRVPIIALTAHAMKEDRQKCLTVGMDDYLTKPFDREQLIAVLRRWLPPHAQIKAA